MRKHTPGPWMISPYSDEDGDIDIVSNYKLLPDGRRQANWVANCDLQGDPEENQANAKLVSASPALLDALEFVDAQLQEIYRCTDEKSTLNKCVVAMNAIGEAIEKATL